MARPTDSYPESATHGADRERTNGEGRERLEAALAEHGGDLAEAIETTDELEDALTTAILIAASADDEEIDHLTDSTANLVRAVDGLSTEAAADLAEDLGEDADDLADTLELVLDLKRQGHLEDLLTLASAFSASLSTEEIEDLAGTLETQGGDLVELAKLASALDLNAETVEGLNTVLGAVGEANRESEPVGVLGMVRGLRSRDARAGLGYLLALLKAIGRQVR